MFGVSFPELLVLGTVALLVLGPDKLPGMLRTLGQWLAKLRRLTTEVRHQSGIDDVLRAEGFDGGLNELRSMMRGGAPSVASPRQSAVSRNPPAVEKFVADKSREYPLEGPDAYGALPEDLVPGATLTSADTSAPTTSLPGHDSTSADAASTDAVFADAALTTVNPPASLTPPIATTLAPNASPSAAASDDSSSKAAAERTDG